MQRRADIMTLTRMQANLATTLLLSFCMSGTISFAMTAINSGFAGAFVARWAHNYLIAFIVALPTSLIVRPVVKRFIEKRTRSVTGG